MYKLDKSGNAVFSLTYHLVLVIKYRQKVFESEIMINDLKDIFNKISADFGVDIIEQECGTDHIHLLIKTRPSLDLTKYINILKGHSSRELRKKHKDFLKNKLWGDHFWSPSYFLSTSGNVSIDILKQYVENQRAKLEK